MSHRIVIITGTLSLGLKARGPYSDIDKALNEVDTLRDRRVGSQIVEALPLMPDNMFPMGGFVLILGSAKDGYMVYGTYPSEEQAANANSAFRKNPINPYLPLTGQKQACILKLKSL